MRKNYVFIDYENVQPERLSSLDQDHFKVMVFVGASQTRLAFESAAALQRMGSKAEYVKISGNGSNALDFHIAFYIGQLAAQDPTAYFHIISKDAGFDPLVQHLKARKIFAARSKDVADIPLVKAATTKSPQERLDLVVAKLQQLAASKPRTLKTLSSTIGSLFQKQLAEEEVASMVSELQSRSLIAVSGTKVSYTLPAPRA
ncbi:MAG: PIN domain-containing protein [Burkholderiaceae bacterium]